RMARAYGRSSSARSAPTAPGRCSSATEHLKRRTDRMADLLVKPRGTHGKVHDITPESAGWSYVGFGLYRLHPGETAAEATGNREVILVLVEGKARISAAGQNFGLLGERMSVFERLKPHCVYVPNGTQWQAVAETECTLAVCSAPGKGNHPATVITDIGFEERGEGAN